MVLMAESVPDANRSGRAVNYWDQSDADPLKYQVKNDRCKNLCDLTRFDE